MPEVILTLPKFHPKQQLVFDSKATEILYGGSTRAGKSFFIRKAYILYCSQIPGLLCDIFRVNFDDVIRNYMEGETSFPILLYKWQQAGLVKINQTEIVFWNESRISLEHAADDTIMQKHQGVARHVRTFEESAQMLERRIRALCGWVTMSEEMKLRVPEKWKGQFPKIFHSTNPVGISSSYYRRNFVDCRPTYSIERVGPFDRQYIPAELLDNPSENPETTTARIKEAFPDIAIQKALLEHDWASIAGNFFSEWDESRHVIPDFVPPSHWFRFRGMDLGYAEPCCVYWVAVSDGEPFKDSLERERWYPRGAYIIYKEWYLCDEKEPSKGLRYRNEDIRDGIIERTELGHRGDPTLTDSLPFQDRGGESVFLVFANRGKGIILTKGDDSRIVGWNQVRSRLIGIRIYSNRPERTPMLYFTESCKYARDYMPALPRHPSELKKEDAAEHGEATHVADCCRIICMSHTIIKDKVEPMESRIQRELQANRPTIQNILKRSGHAAIN